MKFSVENILCRREIPFLLVSSLLLLLGGMAQAQTEVVLVSEGDKIDLICGDEGTYQLLGSNDDGIPGRFELIEAGSYIPVPGHILDDDLLDDEAELFPSGLSGNYGVIYFYEIDMAVMADTCLFTVDVTSVDLPGLPETVCKNDGRYALKPETVPSDPGAVFFISGPGVTGNQQDGYFFNPANEEVPADTISIRLDYAASNGCQKNSNFTVIVTYVPVISFYYTPSCIAIDGQEVGFTNTTSGRDFAVESWDWDFGDPASGSANKSILESPNHFYSEPRSWVVSLTATTYSGCVESSSRNIVLDGKPLVDFSWLHDCYISGDSTAFLNRSVSNTDIDELIWKISNGSGDLFDSIWSNQPEDTIWVSLGSQEEYTVNLYVENESGCSDESTRSIRLKPLYSLGGTGYIEAFDGEGSDWVIDSETGNESWVLGTPDFAGFSAGEGDQSWYTDLPVQDQEYIENSWVESPCFDLSQMSSPMIQLDLMRSFVPGTDGAVLQYQDLATEGWKTIGTVGDGLNWYNSWGIDNRPGGSSFGWGLSEFQPDMAWLHAGYPLDSLARIPFVKFRVVIGSGAAGALGNQGFAFDNFFLGERVRTSLLEHFTNSSSQAALDADLVVAQFAKDTEGMLIDLQYHMDYPGEDPMNLNNPEPPSVRAFNYGVPTVPYALLNGGTDPTYRYDFSDESEEPDDGLVLLESLKVPPFNMDLTVDYANYKLEGAVNVSCSAASYASNIQLYVVVIEELLTVYTGVSETASFRNVVLDMLMTPAGKLLGNDWNLGDSEHLSFQWDYASYVEDIDELSVVAYLFDRDQNLVLQAAELKYSPPVGISPLPDPGRVMAIYPNPARDFVYVNMGSEATLQGELRIVDASGRLLMMADVSPGQVIRQLDIASLDQGFYLVQWIESGRVKGYGSLIRMR